MKEMLVNATDIFFQVLNILIFIRIVASWVGYDHERNGKLKLLYYATEPILEPFRKLLSRFQGGMMFDFSPIVALIFLEIINSIIRNLLISFL